MSANMPTCNWCGRAIVGTVVPLRRGTSEYVGHPACAEAFAAYLTESGIAEALDACNACDAPVETPNPGGYCDRCLAQVARGAERLEAGPIEPANWQVMK